MTKKKSKMPQDAQDYLIKNKDKLVGCLFSTDACVYLAFALDKVDISVVEDERAKAFIERLIQNLVESAYRIDPSIKKDFAQKPNLELAGFVGHYQDVFDLVLKDQKK